jgi:hypothetical protein
MSRAAGVFVVAVVGSAVSGRYQASPGKRSVVTIRMVSHNPRMAVVAHDNGVLVAASFVTGIPAFVITPFHAAVIDSVLILHLETAVRYVASETQYGSLVRVCAHFGTLLLV